MPGWTPTTPTLVSVDTTGGNVSGIEFGDFQYVAISGTVFNDLTGNGIYDGGDPGLQGWTVDLVDYYNFSIVYQSTTTDVNGNYSFTNVGPGTYAVLQEIQGGWIQTYPPSNEFYGGYVVSGSDYTGLDYGDFALVTYAGTVYNDVTGNGMFDGGDTGLGGWTVNLYSSGSLVASATTASDGSYSFSNIGPGNYVIQEVTPSGWIITQPGSPYSYSETAISGDTESSLNFGNFKLAAFSGSVFNDLNGDGHKQANEPNLGGWTVELLDSHGNVAASTVTSKTGAYSFTGIYPGTFTIAEVVKSGWHQTTSPTVYVEQALSGTTTSGLIFGDKFGAPTVAFGGSTGVAAGSIGGPIGLTITTDLSVPSSYTSKGPSAVVVPGVSQPAPVKVVYNGDGLHRGPDRRGDPVHLPGQEEGHRGRHHRPSGQGSSRRRERLSLVVASQSFWMTEFPLSSRLISRWAGFFCLAQSGCLRGSSRNEPSPTDPSTMGRSFFWPQVQCGRFCPAIGRHSAHRCATDRFIPIVVHPYDFAHACVSRRPSR